MTKELLFGLKDFLEDKTIGKNLAHEWIKEQLNSLVEPSRFGLFKTEDWDFRKIRFNQVVNIEYLLGQKEVEDEAVGFVAGFVNGKLRVLSVFADLKDKFIWVRKEGRRVYRGNTTMGLIG